jgi:hypothetical protein
MTKPRNVKLLIEFANARGAARRLGPFDRLRFEGEVLIAQPGGIIARHAEHTWHLTSGGTYIRLECNVPVVIRFYSDKKRQSRPLGPFKDFSSVNGIAYTNRQVFAFSDLEQKDWYSHELSTHWKGMVVEPA